MTVPLPVPADPRSDGDDAITTHPYVSNDPWRAIREALAIIESNERLLLAEVHRLSEVVYRLQGPM